MGLLDWLFRSPRFDRIPDCYTVKRSYLWVELKKAIQFQQQRGHAVWIVTHFPDQFTAAQDLLADWQIHYSILEQPIDSVQIAEISQRNPQTVHLALAELLTPSDRTDFAVDPKLTLAIIAVERHPLIDLDRQLESYAQSTPCRVIFGYYLSLDDPVIRPHLSENMFQVLSQYGMKESELIHSLIVTKAINRALKLQAKNYSPDYRADSAAEWLRQSSEGSI